MSKSKWNYLKNEPTYIPIAYCTQGQVHMWESVKLWKPHALQNLCNNMTRQVTATTLLVFRHRMFHIVRWLPRANDQWPVYEWTVTQRFSNRKKQAALMAMALIDSRAPEEEPAPSTMGWAAGVSNGVST
jgi:hypothetical protein